ncbi:MAG: hypothetical protein GKR90_12350 [Pseudomonadales bacterium]|nr:hypothetical protein [Pseudomonadales bacterium]
MINDKAESSGTIPLIVGVTGHRDLVEGEVAALEAAAEKFFVNLQSRYPDLPILVLSSLAEGADTLITDVAIRCQCRVQIVLPMPYELFATDFVGDARVKFDSMLEGQDVIELPLFEGVSEAEVSALGDARDRQYARLGSFLAAHSHILLALWDGRYKNAVGGTSQIIQFHQKDVSALSDDEERSRLDIGDDESDLVYHIACTRRSSGAPESGLTVAAGVWFTRDDRAPRVTELPLRYDQVFERTQTFNRDIAASQDLAQPYDLEPVDDLLSATGIAGSEAIRRVYLYSDALAELFQRRVLWSLRLTLMSALGAGLSFILYADFADQGYMIWGYLLFVALTVGSYLLAESRKWQRRYVDYRALAEGLRVQFYWSISGVEMSNPNRYSHDSFFQGRDLQLGWIRNVMRYTGLHADGVSQVDGRDLEVVVDGWVGDRERGQFGYYFQRADDKLRNHKRTQRLIRGCFLLGVTAAAILAFFGGTLLSDTGGVSGNLLVALMGLLPITAAARQNYAHRMAERELVAQFAHMRDVFANARRLIDNAGSQHEKRQILKDLGEAALSEHAQWVLRQRERPLPGGDAVN